MDPVLGPCNVSPTPTFSLFFLQVHDVVEHGGEFRVQMEFASLSVLHGQSGQVRVAPELFVFTVLLAVGVVVEIPT